MTPKNSSSLKALVSPISNITHGFVHVLPSYPLPAKLPLALAHPLAIIKQRQSNTSSEDCVTAYELRFSSTKRKFKTSG